MKLKSGLTLSYRLECESFEEAMEISNTFSSYLKKSCCEASVERQVLHLNLTFLVNSKEEHLVRAWSLTQALLGRPPAFIARLAPVNDWQ